MNLVIHDLNEKQWAEVSEQYEGWRVINDKGTIRPCTGCFCCWNKTPGKCIQQDGYENMGQYVHEADEVTIISKYCYGGVSGFVKNVFDRCLGYVLPHFEIVNGESHHQKRYDEDKPFTFIFYGHDLDEQQKKCAERYAAAVCANFRSHVKEVIFKEFVDEVTIKTSTDNCTGDKLVLLNGSVRHQNGNSARLTERLQGQLKKECENIALVKQLNDLPGLVRKLEDAPVIVLCLPLYVDGLPSQVIRMMQTFEKEYKGGRKKIYVLANMGLYESQQLVNLFEAVKQWCQKMKFEYCGGLGVSAGELVGVLIEHLPFGFWPTGRIANGMKKLAEGINEGKAIEDILTGPYSFPRALYIAIANNNWAHAAKRNGIKKEDLFRRL